MQVQSSFVRIKRKTIFYLIVAIITLGIVTPALAAYLGPDRVVTEATSNCKVILYECQYVPAKDDWRYKKADDWSCSNEGKPWQAYSSNPSSQGCFAGTAGDSYWSKEETLQEVTTSYPPATINSSLQNCTSNNGWCNTATKLSLSGIEPVAGYNILAIEGTLNGQTFACSGANCSVPLSEGNNSFTFWALSSWGDSSEMGTFTTNVDSQLPSITGTLSGTTGSNGWYLGPASFNGSASDVTSGLASFTCTLDGTALPSCNSITVNTAGLHTLVLTARDNAGNTRILNQNTSVDTQNPVLTAGLSGTLGSNNWYTAATINASASDPIPGSGLSAFEYNQDNSSWVTFPASGMLTLPEGKHHVDIRAVDNAGRTVSSSKSFWLDSIAPSLTLNPSGTSGANNWYTSGLSLGAFASDATSGMELLEYSLNNDVWKAYTAPLSLSDGTHSLSFWVQDSAGLVTQVDRIYRVDTQAPQISGSLSGVPGTNGWYTSNVTLTASVSDPTPGSGLDAFTYTLNNSTKTPYSSALILTGGKHTVQLNAEDKAGLTSSMEQTIKVDTMVPFLNVQTTLPNWINDSVTLNGTSSDPSMVPGQASSGLSKVEISTDGGQTWQTTTDNASWSYTWNSTESSNGIHDVHIRAIDNAGLTTEQTLAVGVDNSAPKISLPDSWYQWDTVTLDIWDNHSGLAEARVEISDPEGRWPARKIRLDLESFPMDFKWDRCFGDGTVAPLGTYDVKVLAFDSMGNLTHKNASINILLGILPAGPASTPQPYVRVESAPIPQTNAVPLSSSALTQPAVVSAFGSTPEPAAQETTTSESIPTSRVAPTQTNVLDWLQSIFIPDENATESKNAVGTPDESSNVPQTAASESNVLWGATAAAMIGAATAYALDEKRKRQEEAERKRAEIEARIAEQAAQQKAAEGAHKVAQWLEGQVLLKEKALHELEMGDVTEKERLAAYKQSTQYQSYQARMAEWHKQQAKLKAIEEADLTESERLAQYTNSADYKEREATLLQYHQEERVRTADSARWAGLASQGENAANMPRKTWWEKTIHWVDEHQAEIALGFGAAVGVAAIILSGGVATPLVAAAWIAGAAAVAGGTVALGTIALNVHYGRDWKENVVRNLAISAITAGAITGVGFLLSGPTVITMGNGIAGYCATQPAICNRVDVVVKTWDTLEEVGLVVQGTVQTLRGDSISAAQTHLELQLEYLDGGVPGNTLAVEIGEQLAKLDDDATQLIAAHGDGIIPLLLAYGDDAVDIIGAYGDEGISLLLKYGDQGDEVIELVRKHGTPAVTVLNTVDPDTVNKLLTNLDKDVLDYAIIQGSDAVDALSRWNEELLTEHGPELALRSKQDAKVLADVQKLIALGPIDPKNLTKEQQELINAIAENSTFYTDAEQAVLGKWSGFSGGYAGQASATGSLHYYPHQDMWNLLGELGDDQQAEIAWLINKEAVQPMIDKGLPIEYTLKDIPNVNTEKDLIEGIWKGTATEIMIMDRLGLDYVPGRMKELQTLKDAGYQLAFDELQNSYILIKP